MFPRTIPVALLAASLALAFAHAEVREVKFERDVRPILKAHCTHCHGEEEKPKGGVDLRLRRFMDKVLDEGRHVLVPGQPDASEILALRRGKNEADFQSGFGAKGRLQVCPSLEESRSIRACRERLSSCDALLLAAAIAVRCAREFDCVRSLG